MGYFMPGDSVKLSKEDKDILNLALEVYLGVYSLIALGCMDYSGCILMGFEPKSLVKERKKKPSSQYVDELIGSVKEIQKAIGLAVAQEQNKKRKSQYRWASSWAVKAHSALEALKPVVDRWKDSTYVEQWRLFQQGEMPIDSNGKPLFNGKQNDGWPGEAIANRCLDCAEGIYKWINHGVPLDILF